MGGEDRVDRFTTGFPSIGAAPEEGVYLLEQDNSPSVSEPQLLEGACERCKARMFPGKSPYSSGLRGEAIFQVGSGWLEGPYELSRDAALRKPGEPLRRNPARRCGAPHEQELGAAGDLRESATNRTAQVLTPINLPT